MVKKKPRILFVSLAGSIHAASWVRQVEQAGYETAFFHSLFTRPWIHPRLQGYSGKIYVPISTSAFGVEQAPLFRNAYQYEKAFAAQGEYAYRHAEYFAWVIEVYRPDLVHCLGLCINFKNMGRVVNSARALMRSFPPLIYSSWGADLDFFSKLHPEEEPAIREFVRQADYYVSECGRDFELVKQLGFAGKFLGYLPANGGFPDDQFEIHGVHSVSERKKIFVKGRDISDGDPVGRASTILTAMSLIPEKIKPFEVCIGQTRDGDNIRRMAQNLTAQGFNIRILPHVSTEELYSILKDSRLLLASTINDGLPISLMEAMAFGVYPIHSDLDSIRDFIQSRKNGSLFPPEDPTKLADEIKWALDNPRALEHAQSLNLDFVRKNLLQSNVSSKFDEIYAPTVRVKKKSYMRKLVPQLLHWCKTTRENIS